MLWVALQTNIPAAKTKPTMLLPTFGLKYYFLKVACTYSNNTHHMTGVFTRKDISHELLDKAQLLALGIHHITIYIRHWRYLTFIF